MALFQEKIVSSLCQVLLHAFTIRNLILCDVSVNNPHLADDEAEAKEVKQPGRNSAAECVGRKVGTSPPNISQDVLAFCNILLPNLDKSASHDLRISSSAP